MKSIGMKYMSQFWADVLTVLNFHYINESHKNSGIILGSYLDNEIDCLKESLPGCDKYIILASQKKN